MSPEEQSEHRARAEREASEDLAKEARHLLYDIHDELLRFDRQPIARLSDAQKRLASLTVKNAESAEALARETLALHGRIAIFTEKLHKLTVVLVWLTVALFILTACVAYPIIINLL